MTEPKQPTTPRKPRAKVAAKPKAPTKPRPKVTAKPADLAEPAADAEADRQAAIDNDEDPAQDYSVAVSPRQLAGGFAIIAALILLVVRSRRRKKG
jgi:hypothetical protein